MKFILIKALTLALGLMLSSCLGSDEEQKKSLPFEVIDQFGTAGGDGGDKLTLDGQGNIYLTGSAFGALPGNQYYDWSDVFLVKYDPAGQRQWIRQTGSYHEDVVAGVGTDIEGNVYMAGYFSGSLINGSMEGFVSKYNPSGKQQWISKLSCLDGGFDLIHVHSMATNTSGDSYLTGITECPLKEGVDYEPIYDVFLAKYNSQGGELWVEQLREGEGRDLALDNDGNIYLLSNELYNVSCCGPVLVKYDPDGQLLWAKDAGDPAIYNETAIALNASGDIYITGKTYGDDNIFLAKHDADGDRIWIRQFELSLFPYTKDIAIDKLGHVYITGFSRLGGPAGLDTAFLLKYNSEKEEQWLKYFSTGDDGKGQGLAIAPSGKIYLTGRTEGAFPGFQNQGSNDIFLIKYPGLTVY